MGVTAIIVAGGSGTRLGRGEPKAFAPLGGKPLFVYALRTFVLAPAVSDAVLVVPARTEEHARSLIDAHGPWRCPIRVAAGGAERQDSVRAGLAAAQGDLIAIHDAARPFVSSAVVAAAIDAARVHGAAVVAAPASDTVKQVDAAGRIAATLPRDRVWLAQTPQVFKADLIRRAHADALAHGVAATDDAVLVERLGVAVQLVPGDPDNRKITTPGDLAWAEWRLATRPVPR
jgi:2-C-methyl-D-erythritol 4-phosphate cytidylyltransferase